VVWAETLDEKMRAEAFARTPNTMRGGIEIMSIGQVHAYIDQHADIGISMLKRLIDHRSTSSDGCGIRECALFLEKLLKDMGITARIIETSGHPVVYGECRAKRPDAPTIVIYNHYDVQPAGNEAAWDTPPFSAIEKNGRIYGRGAGDNKGQLTANLFGVLAWLQVNKHTPVNVKFIYEGEEEIGCRSFQSFLNDYPELLCGDVVVISDSGIHTSGAPFILYGVRGSLRFSLRSVTSNTDHHSGNKGGVIPEAAWELIDVLSSMRDADGKVVIEGFYDGIVNPTAKDLEMIDSAPYDPEELSKTYGLARPLTLSKREYYSRLMFTPTFSVLAMQSGQPIGEGTPGAIPGKAQVMLNVRFPYAQTAQQLFRAINEHVKKRNPSIEVIFHNASAASRTMADLPIMEALSSAVEIAFGKKAIQLPAMGASWGSFYLWEQLMHIPAVIIPYANADENNHGPNENIRIDCFVTGAHTIAQILQSLDEFRN